MSAKDRARLMHWNIDGKPKAQRDPAGDVIAQEIRAWNAEAARAYRAWKKLADDLKFAK